MISIKNPKNKKERDQYTIKPLQIGINCAKYYVSYLTIKNLRIMKLEKENENRKKNNGRDFKKEEILFTVEDIMWILAKADEFNNFHVR